MGSVVVPASPVRMEKLEAKPVTRRKPSLCPTRWNIASAVAPSERGAIPGTGGTAKHSEPSAVTIR